MGVFSAIESLQERGITLEGEQYYAVVTAYLEKINALTNSTKAKLHDFDLLKQAGKADVVANEHEMHELGNEFGAVLDEFAALLGSENECMSNYIKAKLESDEVSQEESVQYLHNLAYRMQLNKNDDLKAISRRVSNADSQLNSAKEMYVDNYNDYCDVIAIEHNAKALEKFFHTKAPSCKLSEDMKQIMVNNAAEIEEKFLKDFQNVYIEKAVDYAVDNDCQMHKAMELASAESVFA